MKGSHIKGVSIKSEHATRVSEGINKEKKSQCSEARNTN